MRTKENRNAVRPSEAHPEAGSAATTRAKWCTRRIPPRCHRAKPPQAGQADPATGFVQSSLRRRALSQALPRSPTRAHDLLLAGLLQHNPPKADPLRRGWREGALRICPMIRPRRRDQQGSTHIPSGRSASSIDAFPRKLDGFLTRLAILGTQKASSESLYGYTSSQDSDKDCTGGT